VAIGRADGTVRVGRVQSDSSYLKVPPKGLDALNPGETIIYDGGVAFLSPAGPRLVKTVAELSEPLNVTSDAPSAVRLVDYVYDDRQENLVALLKDGRLFFDVISKTQNLMTGETARSVDNYPLPRPAYEKAGPPVAVLMGLNGRMVYVVYADGHCIRYETIDPANASIVEEADLLPDPATKIAAVKMLAGNETLIVTDTEGDVSGWFAAPYPENIKARTTDKQHLVQAHVLDQEDAPITTIATSGRDRQFVTADRHGKMVLRHMTSGTTQATINTHSDTPIALVAISPKNDAIASLDANGHFTLFSVDNPHPDGGMAALFTPIHYEGYAQAAYIWQSSAGSDTAEPKLSLIPLIFGTIKATFYALLFAIPIAIAAAIYTSEFMQPRVRSVVKPVIEMMASLPSVVLGFIAALVLAPFIEQVVPAVLLTFIAVPLGVMLFGFIWQILPPQLTRSLPGWLPFAMMVILVTLSLLLGFALGPVLEDILFYGDFKGWVDINRHVGNAVPGWICLLTPLFTVALILIFNMYLRRRIPLFNGGGTRLKIAVVDLCRFAATGVVAFGLAYLLGLIFNQIGWDLRGDWMVGALRMSPIGGYTQRNTLVLGMIMGFAIIPIIYTVSEDALNAVPASLRSAALGAGATPWQTAIRVVMPVAVSGIFSACMIGLGRAAGETMIVLMAGGNTALMDANIFNGVRTLSANIAVELPEAAVHSTHYRVLFLSALVLFALTFIVNTTAEIVRTRFRKRAYQL
jgi:phosphate transport system permease protein